MSFLRGFKDALVKTSGLKGIVFGNSIGYLLNKAFVASVPSECGFVHISDDTDFSMAVDPKLGPLVARNIAVSSERFCLLLGIQEFVYSGRVERFLRPIKLIQHGNVIPLFLGH